MQAETKRSRIADPFLAEIDQEAVITKRLLDIIPEDKLSFRPHPKAKSLGELAMHIATLQGVVAELGRLDSKEAGGFPPDVEATSRAQILDAFAESLKRAREIVGATDDERAVAEWKLTRDGNTLVAMPRIGFLALDPAQPQLPSSRAALGIPPRIGRPIAVHLWPQCGHRSVCLSLSTVNESKCRLGRQSGAGILVFTQAPCLALRNPNCLPSRDLRQR